MFPKLSEKAWDEIRSDGYYADTIDERKLAVNAFMSLFDLEKYPITKDMVFEYLLKADFEDRMPYGLHSTKKSWEFWNKDTDMVGCGMPIKDILYWMSIKYKDQLIIIGEIHGWWEGSTD